jgi:serine phosphatase RsbU (regulator of sigma subunit)
LYAQKAIFYNEGPIMYPLDYYSFESQTLFDESDPVGEVNDPVFLSFLDKKIDIEANGFKKMTQELQNEEEKLHKEIEKRSDFTQNKEVYEKDRLEWKEALGRMVSSSRKEKQELKERVKSNLETASEMAQDLMDETGPDYTGGDD